MSVAYSNASNPYYNYYKNVSRDINLVLLKGGDVVSFVDDVIPVDSANPGLQMADNQALMQGNQLSWGVQGIQNNEQLLSTSQRGLVYYRISNGVVVQGPRPVYYVPTGGPFGVGLQNVVGQSIESMNVVRVLREVYNPKITYDADANVLHLWFWANAQTTVVNGAQSYSRTTQYNFGMGTTPISVRSGVQYNTYERVLYYTTGKFVKSWAKGAYLYGYQTLLAVGNQNGYIGTQIGLQGFQNEGYDLVPLFNDPFPIAATTDVSQFGQGGIVNDGYDVGGIQMPAMFPMYLTSRNGPFFSGWGYPMGIQGPQVSVLADPVNLNWYDSTTLPIWVMGTQTCARILGDGM